MKYSLLIIIFLIIPLAIFGQYDYKNYDMTCYCSATETPHAVASYDNNLEILIALKNGLSKAGLDSLNIKYTYSQLKLLQVYNLILKRNNKYYLNIPILTNEQTDQLRTVSKNLANKITLHIENEISDLITYLNSTGYTKNSFSIIFSYILDGKIWEKFEERKVLKPFSRSNDMSPWEGYFWILSSKREVKYGTNSQTDSNLTFSVTSGAPNRILKTFYVSDNLIDTLLINIIQSGKVVDKNAIEAFKKFNIVDDFGNVNVPIISEKDQSKLFELSNSIVTKICDDITTDRYLNDITKIFKFSSLEQTVVILYHEILWDLLDNLVEKKLITKPMIILNPDKAVDSDLSDLIFLIIK